jgi:agmatinase
MNLKELLNGYLRLPRSFFGIRPPTEGYPDVGVLGVPYDLTSSHTPGCRFGPDAIRQATDSERSTSFPLSFGSKERDMAPLSKKLTLEDIGDLEVMLRLPEAAAVDMSEAAAKLAQSESHLLFLGGDHFITYPLLRGLKRERPDDYGLVYFDSHADFYEDMGGYQLSHASTVKRIVDEDLVKIENVAAFDLRSAAPDQREQFTGGSASSPISVHDFGKTLREIADRVGILYLSVDLDVLAPEVAPGVSHPESGGPNLTELMECLRVVLATKKVRYADVVELNPLLDQTGRTAIVARDVVKEILFGFSGPKAF